MDLNKLYFQHQIALLAAAGETEAAAQEARRAEATDIARRIRAIQSRSGAAAAQTWCGKWLSNGHWLPSAKCTADRAFA
jgi:outer membrane lipopolysaccharide assembly protein LptE/RlpB